MKDLKNEALGRSKNPENKNELISQLTSGTKKSETTSEKFSAVQIAIQQQQEKEKEHARMIDELRNRIDNDDLKIRGSGEDDQDDDKHSHSSHSDEEKIKDTDNVPLIDKKSRFFGFGKDQEYLKTTMLERVFWTKEKMAIIRQKFRLSRDKIKHKTDGDFRNLREAIEEKDKKNIL